MKWTYSIIIGLLSLFFILRLIAGYIEEPNYFGRSDFAVFYTTAQFNLHGEEIYGNQALYKAVLTNRLADGSVRYLYPPIALLIFIPLTLFSFSTAAWVWLGFNLLLLGSTILLTQKLLQTHFAKRDWIVVMSIIAMYSPLFFSLRAGQVDLLLTVGLLLHLLFVQKGRNKLAALLLGLIIVIKIYPVIILFYYLLSRRFQLVWYSIVSILFITLLSISILGLESHNQYLKRIPALSASGIHQKGISRFDNPTLNGLLYRITVMSRTTTDRSLSDYIKIFKKTEMHYSVHEIQRNQWLHLVFVIPLFCFMTLATLYRTNKSEFNDLVGISLWIGFVFLGAKDAHVHYFVLYLPLLFTLLLRPPGWILAKRIPSVMFMIGLVGLSLSNITLLPFIDLPDILSIVPLALVGNAIIVLYVSYYYMVQQAEMTYVASTAKRKRFCTNNTTVGKAINTNEL